MPAMQALNEMYRQKRWKSVKISRQGSFTQVSTEVQLVSTKRRTKIFQLNFLTLR